MCTVSSGSRTVPVFPSSGRPLAVEISYPKTALSNAALRDKAKTVAESYLLKVGLFCLVWGTNFWYE